MEILGTRVKSQMNSQFLVFIQVFIAAVFVIWILSRRGRNPKPTVLNMTTDNKTKPKIKTYNSVNFTEGDEVQAKVLNVIFMWNGHSWDAYEVFGLPAGSPIEHVRERYTEMVAVSSESQKLFLNEALKAINSKNSN